MLGVTGICRRDVTGGVGRASAPAARCAGPCRTQGSGAFPAVPFRCARKRGRGARPHRARPGWPAPVSRLAGREQPVVQARDRDAVSGPDPRRVRQALGLCRGRRRRFRTAGPTVPCVSCRRRVPGPGAACGCASRSGATRRCNATGCRSPLGRRRPSRARCAALPSGRITGAAPAPSTKSANVVSRARVRKVTIETHGEETLRVACRSTRASRSTGARR